MNLIKSFLTAFFALSLSTAVSAESVTPVVKWNAAEGSLRLSGPVAIELYQSLKAPERLDPNYSADPMAARGQERRTKDNVFAQCWAMAKKEVVGGDVITWKTVSAECDVIAPKGTVD